MAGFEEQLTQLETVVKRLELGDLTLEESVQLFEQGMQLSNSCKEQLERAEGRIQVLVETKGGEIQVADLELEGDNQVDTEENEDEDGE